MCVSASSATSPSSTPAPATSPPMGRSAMAATPTSGPAATASGSPSPPTSPDNSMAGEGQHERIAQAYLRFADEEARGRSPLYEALTRGVTGDAEVLAFLVSVPGEKRQPNLLL